MERTLRGRKRKRPSRLRERCIKCDKRRLRPLMAPLSETDEEGHREYKCRGHCGA